MFMLFAINHCIGQISNISSIDHSEQKAQLLNTRRISYSSPTETNWLPIRQSTSKSLYKWQHRLGLTAFFTRGE